MPLFVFKAGLLLGALALRSCRDRLRRLDLIKQFGHDYFVLDFEGRVDDRMRYLCHLHGNVGFDQADLLLVAMIDFRHISGDGFPVLLSLLLQPLLQVHFVEELPYAIVLVSYGHIE